MSKKRIKSIKEEYRLPNLAPERYVTQYFEYRNEVSKSERPAMKPNGQLLGIHNRSDRITEALKRKRELFVIKQGKLNTQWDNLEKNELNLRDSVQNFHAFVQSNLSKRLRAARTIEYNRKFSTQIQQEIDILRVEYNKCKEMHVLMGNEISQQNRFGRFMTGVTEISDFCTKEHILRRYEELMDTREKQLQKRLEQLESLDELSRDMFAKNESNRLSIIGLNNNLIQLQDKYKEGTNKTAHLEALVLSIIDRCKELIENTSNVLSVIEVMYQSICIRKRAPISYTKNELPEMIKAVRYTLDQFKQIIGIIEKNKNESMSNLTSEH